MRKTLLLFVLMLAGAFVARPSFAACPGVSDCPRPVCPAGAKQVKPGQSIQKAIDAAPATGAAICVPPGTYTLPSGSQDKEVINFHGKPINLVASGGPSVTFIDGGGKRGVVFNAAEGKDSILNGFTVRNGISDYGAGILIDGASPTIRNCVLSKNKATGDYGRGGGIGVIGVQAHPAILCTRFVGNSSSFAGGGLMSTYSANPYLRSDVFEGNTAQYGGAIGVHWSGRLDLGWTQLIGNQAKVDGGGIHVGLTSSNALVRQVWFQNNKASGYGGGMWVPAGFAEVVNSMFDGNEAGQGGGIAAGYGGMADVASTLFVRNKTGNPSAALVNAQGSSTSVVNHYNGFFSNTGGDFLNTYGNLGTLLFDPKINGCCPAPGSPAIDAGIPDPHYIDVNGSRNDMGICGGPALSTYGPMK